MCAPSLTSSDALLKESFEGSQRPLQHPWLTLLWRTGDMSAQQQAHQQGSDAAEAGAQVAIVTDMSISEFPVRRQIRGGSFMRKIIVGAQVSMDGVMQAPGGPWEDPTKGFKFGGWVMPYFDEVFGEEIDRVFEEKCDLLLGRKTYEIFAAYWPYYDEDAPHGSIAKLFKDIKKYVISRSGDVGCERSVTLSRLATHADTCSARRGSVRICRSPLFFGRQPLLK